MIDEGKLVSGCNHTNDCKWHKISLVMDLAVLSLCRLLLDFSVKANSEGAVFLFLLDYTQTGVEPNKSSRLTHAAWFNALSSSYVTVVTAVNARQQDGKTAARGLGSEWRAVVGVLGLHPLST